MKCMTYRILASILGTIALTGCIPNTAPSTEILSVTASFYPLAYLAEEVGGALVNVHQITPAGVEPHDYEPSPQDIAAIHDAAVFLLNGAGLDPWAEKIHDERKGTSAITVKMVDHVALLDGPHDGHNEDDEHAEDEHDEEEDHPEESHDPHIWLDPVLMKKGAELVRDAFIQADPEHADMYRANADTLIASLDTLHSTIMNGLAECAIREVVVSHNAFGYLSARYDFASHALAGLSPEEEPSARKMAEIAEIARAKNIRYIFFETLASPKLSDTIAREIGAQTLVLNPIEGLTPEDKANGSNYISLMEENLTNLRTAMQCQ